MGRLAPRLGGPRFATLFGLLALGSCCAWLIFALTAAPAFVTLWLPASLLAGVGMGATTTATSAAAAMSAPPAMFASASGLNTTARQFGGALGIAAMATIVANSHADHGTGAYSNVYVFCTVMVALAFAVAAIWLRLAPPAAVPAPGARPAGASVASAARQESAAAID